MKIDGLSPGQGQVKFWYDGLANSLNSRYPLPSNQFLVFPAAITSVSQFNCGLIPDIIATDSTAQENLIDSATTSAQFNDSLERYYREVYAFATLSEDSSYLSDALRLAFYQQKQLQNIGRFAEIIDMLRVGLIDTALTINNNIVDENTVEVNLKLYYQILLPTLLESPLLPNATDTASMENIIYQNAYEGGDAVIRIRAYLRKIMVDHHIGLMRIINETKQNIINNVIVYPSPLLENQHLSIESNSEHIMSIEIYDAIGKKIKHVNVSNTDLKILLDISDISPGFYHIKIETESKAIFNSNFIKL
ncbi:MAG: T9SS type A sorting domain-containing protein [Bacteroidetes bacterium]|nr:T9SS type A sorting domain-containing protein [Bacteroidota bacterium]